MGRLIALLALLAGLGAAAPPGAAQDARAAVEAFVARLADVRIADLVIRQTLTLYHPDGRHPHSTGEQQVFFKLPRRQRVEQTVEGRREVRLAVGDQAWIRQADGKTYEVPAGGRGSDRTHLLVPFRRSAADLLAEWRALGVRDDVTHTTRVGGRAVTVIGARPGEHDTPAVWLDAERGVLRFITRERLPKGPGVVDVAFSEHRPLPGGFHFPYRQEAFVDGKLVVLITVRSVAVNTNLPDALFDPGALARER
ncbi:MAG: hypothetical protein HYU26_10525 [Candidatus Rokubacteria bacterium]|nr:hypothetical protein [Candidatus Rokubacteria bacterium]